MKHIRLNNGYKFYLNTFTFNKVLQFMAFDPYFLDERIDFISELIDQAINLDIDPRLMDPDDRYLFIDLVYAEYLLN